jgi:hypothetical protein
MTKNQKIVLGLVAGIFLILGVAGVGAVMALRSVISSGATAGPDQMFGDQHLKTAVALIELHKVRYGHYFLLTRLFHGDGSFEEHTYLIAIAYAPLYLISRIVELIPILAWLVILGLFFYQLLPGYYAIRAAHPRLSSRQALYVVLIPIGAITVLFGLFFLVWFMLFFGVQLFSS